jgi:thiol peroxidase
MLTNSLVGALVGVILALTVRAFVGLAVRERVARSFPGYGPFGIIGALVGGIVGIYFLGTIGDKALAKIPSVDTVDSFREDVLGADRPVVVDFYLPTCPPCKVLAPRLVELSREYGDRVDFVKINGQDESLLPVRQEYHVVKFPTVHLFVNGRSQQSWLGINDKEVYANEIDRHLAKMARSRKGSMMTQRTGEVTFKGDPLTLVGPKLEVGQEAPDFVAVGNDLNPVKLSDYKGKVVILSSVPSLDTSVCAKQTRTFNERAGGMDDTVVLTVSMDLPFAQSRWCGAEGIENVVTVSDHRDADFGKRYGLLIQELRLLARAVIVVDREGKITYIQVVDEMTDEPDYDAALKAAQNA